MAKKLIVPPPGARLASEMAGDKKTGLNALIYGAPKTGKTSLLFSLLELGSLSGLSLLHLDFDVSPDAVPRSDRVVHVPVKPGKDGWEQVKSTLHWATATEAQTEIGAVLVDGLSTANDHLMDWVLDKKGVKGKNGMLAMPSDYTAHGQVKAEMVGFVRTVREWATSKGWHIVFTAHEREFKDDRGRKEFKPALSGQARDLVPGIPDFVGRLIRTQQGQRILSLHPEDGTGLQYRQDANAPRLFPDRIKVKDFSDHQSEGETLATIAQKLGH